MHEKNNGRIKVLQINAGSKDYGGVSAMVFGIYKNIDKEKFQFDFVSPRKTTYEIKRREIEEMGGNIIELDTKGNLIRRKIQLYFRLKKIIEKERYQIVHINSGSFFFNLQVAIISKKLNVKKIIIHSHNGKNPNKKVKNIFIKIFKPLIKVYGTDFLTCSNEASENMYTKKMIQNNEIIMIPNGIETDKFKYNENVRNRYRNKLNIDGKIVLGNIGRFKEQKNHKFLLEVFKELLKINSNFVLLLIGEGELKQKIEDYTEELKISENVLFLGLREDISELLMCMDIFIMTSIHEGLPVVGIEAQASGLPLVLSDCITKEINVSNNIKYISLSESPTNWAIEINKIAIKENNREESYKNVKEKGFDIKETVKKIEKIYLSKNENIS